MKAPLPSANTSALDAARAYVARGLYPIPLCTPSPTGTGCNTPWHNKDAPCAKPGKVPTVREWGATEPTDAKLLEWFGRAQRNVGLALRGMVAFDLDSAEGEAELLRAVAELGPLPPTWENTSGRGRHLVFRFPDGADDTGIKGSLTSVSLKDGTLKHIDGTTTGLDIRAGRRTRSQGQIAVAPSMHETGRRYVTKDNGLDAPAILPVKWFDALPRDRERPPLPASQRGEAGVERPAARTATNADRYLAQLRVVLPDARRRIEAAPDGTQNNTINDVSLRVFRIALGAQQDLDAIATELLNASLRGNHPEGSARATIASARKKAESDGPPELRERERSAESRMASSTPVPPPPRAGDGPVKGMDPHDAALELPVVMVDPRIARVAREALSHLKNHPDVFQRSHIGLVRIVRAPELPDDTTERERNLRPPPHTPIAEPLSPATLAGWLSDVAEFRRIDKKGEVYQVAPPPAVVAYLHAEYDLPGVRPLTGIVEAPSLRPDGTILTQPGHDSRTGLYLAWRGKALDVPERPTRQDARAAYAKLADVFAEFSYQGDKGVMVAATVAAVLTPIARSAIRGPVPMFMFEADAPNAGKTLAANVAGILVTGRAPSARQYTDDDNETEKRLAAVAVAGVPLMLLDNIRGHIEGGAIEAALTAHDTIATRILGSTTDRELPWRVVMYATANGVTYSRDTSRRVVHILLRGHASVPAAGETPGTTARTYRYPDLVAHATEHRAELLRAALVILRAHVVAGRPRAASTLDTFESWSRTVADPIKWVSGCDPILAKPPEHTDRETDVARRVALAWANAFPAQTLTVREVIARCSNAEVSRGPTYTEAVADLRTALCDLAGIADLARLHNNSALGKRIQQHVAGRWFPVNGGGFAAVEPRGRNRNDAALYEALVTSADEQNDQGGEKDPFPEVPWEAPTPLAI